MSTFFWFLLHLLNTFHVSAVRTSNILPQTKPWRDHDHTSPPTRFVWLSLEGPSPMTHIWQVGVRGPVLSNAEWPFKLPQTLLAPRRAMFKDHNNVTKGSDSVICREPTPVYRHVSPHVYNYQACCISSASMWSVYAVWHQRHTCFLTSIRRRCYVIMMPSISRDRLVINPRHFMPISLN